MYACVHVAVILCIAVTYVHVYVCTMCVHNYICPIHTIILLVFFIHTELCANPRSSFVVFVILGILTFGISLIIWYIYLKCQSNEKGKHV